MPAEAMLSPRSIGPHLLGNERQFLSTGRTLGTLQPIDPMQPLAIDAALLRAVLATDLKLSVGRELMARVASDHG